MSLLKLKNLTIGYKKPLVSDLNLEIGSSKLIFLLGENGSGKSTLMKTMFKIIPVLDGKIIYQGRDIQELNAKVWSEVISAVFSRIGVVPMIPVRELIEIGAHNTDAAFTQKVINLLGIETLLDKYANEISDGQLQKVMIARALMQNTHYVFFDEPTAHLDFKNKSYVFNLLKELVHSTQKTFIVISHEILHALELADEIWYIDQGKLWKGDAVTIDQQFQLREQILRLKQYES